MNEPLRVSPVLLEMARHLQAHHQADAKNAKDELLTAVVELVSATLNDSARSPEVETLRAFVSADWLVRRLAPAVLTRWKRAADADRMKSQKPLESQRACESAAAAASSIAMGVDDPQGSAFFNAIESAARAAARRDDKGEVGKHVAAAWLAAHAAAKNDDAAKRVYVTDIIGLVTHLVQLKTR